LLHTLGREVFGHSDFDLLFVKANLEIRGDPVLNSTSELKDCWSWKVRRQLQLLHVVSEDC